MSAGAAASASTSGYAAGAAGEGALTVDVRGLASRQSQAALPVTAAAEQPAQLTLDLGDSPELTAGTGLPEMTGPERVRAAQLVVRAEEEDVDAGDHPGDGLVTNLGEVLLAQRQELQVRGVAEIEEL